MGPWHSIRAASPRSIPGGGSRARGALRDSGRRTGTCALRLLLACGCAWGLGLGLARPAQARGPIYTYTDSRGVTHFTNVPRGDKRYQRMRLAEPPLHERYPAPRYAEYDSLIHEAALAYAVPPALVKAVIAAESAFNPRAISRKGAQGLMQLMPQTAEWLGVLDPLEPTQNVRGGTNYLRAMIDRYGDLSRALAAYNAGPSAVDHYGGIPPYQETRDYVERVLTYYRSYHGDFIR